MANNEKDDIYTLTDEEGNESEFEYLGEITLDDNNYLALIPLDGEDDEYVILKDTTDENGDEMLVTIDDDDEFDRVADAFEDTFMDECDLDEQYVEDEDEDEDEDGDGGEE